MSVKRYRVSYDNGIIEEDGSPRRPADSVPMVKATDFDALSKRLEEAELLLAASHHTKEHKLDCICTVCENTRTFLKARQGEQT